MIADDLRVVVLPSWYRNADQPRSGVYVEEQIAALRERGVATDVVYPDLRSPRSLSLSALKESRFQTTLSEESGVRELRWNGWGVNKWKRLRAAVYVNRARRLLDEYERRFGTPDLVHAHSHLWGGYAAADWCAVRDTPLVVSEHRGMLVARNGEPPALPAWIVRHLRRALDVAAVTALVSEAQRPTLAPLVDRPDEKLRVVPNFVDGDAFPLSTRNGEAGAPTRVVSVGNLKPEKGFDVLVRAFAALRASRPDVELVVVGDGPERARLEALAADLGVAAAVYFRGSLSKEELREEYGRADVFALGSRRESFGIVLLEAGASGLPVVASRAGGPETIVTDKSGLLVEPDDVAEFAAALERVVARRADHDRAARQAIRDDVLARFGKDAVVDHILRVYQDALLATGRDNPKS
jgi:glycosyltransferase involved in cell wall biosynthesis